MSKREETYRKIKKGEKTKQKLFDSAANLFKRYDFTEVTVERIVEEAGVAKGTFYIYFESKDALIAAFLSNYVSKVDTDYRAFLESFPPDTDTSDLLLGLIDKITTTLIDTIGYTSMRTVYKLLLTDYIDMSSIIGFNRELYQMFTDVLEYGINRGEFKSSLSVNELARHFVVAIRGLSYEWCIRYPDFDLKTQAHSHFKVMLDGIKVKQNNN